MARARAAKKFPAAYWDPKMHAYVYLNEFERTKWWTAITVRAWDDRRTAAEIADLRTLKATERDANLGHIIAQHEDIFSYISRMLLITPASHPHTVQLFHVAILVGRAVVMHFKNEWKRPRPTQYAPDLSPPIDVPGHPAYPSGHSTQTHLVALVLSAVVPDHRKALLGFAGEVALNRERAGLHYRSDSDAGITLAGDVLPLLKGGREYRSALRLARREW